MQRFWEILDILKKLPSGSLIQKNIRGHIRYYRQYYVNAKRIQKYIRKADEPRMLHLLRLRRLLLKELRVLARSPAVSGELKRWRNHERQRKKAWDKAQKKAHPETCIHYAPWGDYVRSKSELLIGCFLKHHHLPFYYEKGLELGSRLIHPDFTFFKDGKEYYWEHLGLWNDSRYRREWEDRKALYEQYGIYEGDRLFCTREINGAIDMLEIERQFKRFLQR